MDSLRQRRLCHETTMWSTDSTANPAHLLCSSSSLPSPEPTTSGSPHLFKHAWHPTLHPNPSASASLSSSLPPACPMQGTPRWRTGIPPGKFGHHGATVPFNPEKSQFPTLFQARDTSTEYHPPLCERTFGIALCSLAVPYFAEAVVKACMSTLWTFSERITHIRNLPLGMRKA